MKIRQVSPALGAEITDIDLANNLTESLVDEIRAALAQFGVLMFRDQQLDAEKQKSVGRRFGELFVHPNFVPDGDPEVVMVVRNPGDARIVGEDWHADTTMIKQPPMGALLYAVQTPPLGGDTLFAAQWLAYDALSSGLKAAVENLQCVHSDRRVAGPAAALNAKRTTVVREDSAWRETVNVHPVVRIHPESGRKCLFVNHSYSVRFNDWTEQESRPLLEYLMNWGHRPEFTCRLSYAPGSLVFWDNRSTKHIAVNDVTEGRRIMRRIQIAGDAVV